MSHISAIGWDIIAFILAVVGALTLWLAARIGWHTYKSCRAMSPETPYESSLRSEAVSGAVLLVLGLALVAFKIIHEATSRASWGITLDGMALVALSIGLLAIWRYAVKKFKL